MSVPPVPQGVSSQRARLWLITVIVVVVLTSASAAQIVSAYADAVAVLSLLCTGCGTAVKYRNLPNQRRSVAFP